MCQLQEVLTQTDRLHTLQKFQPNSVLHACGAMCSCTGVIQPQPGCAAAAISHVAGVQHVVRGAVAPEAQLVPQQCQHIV